MNPRAQASYLESQVMTATPQKLRLMLIDGAMLAARQAVEHWQRDQGEAGLECVVRCREILSELLAGMKIDDSELSRRVASVYVFLFRLLTEAQLRRDPDAIQKVIDVLSVEQETWRLVCQQMPNSPIPAPGQEDQTTEITAEEAERMLAKAADKLQEENRLGGSLELDA